MSLMAVEADRGRGWIADRLLIDFGFYEPCQVSQRLLPAEITGLRWNGIRQALLHHIEPGADRYFFQRHSHLDVARQVGIVEFVLDVFMWDFDLRELNGDDLRRDNVRRLL